MDQIIVMGHTHCGGILAANKNISLGLIDQWLQNIKDVANINKDILSNVKDENEFLLKLTELNVLHQTLNVCKTSFVQKAWEQGRKVQVHGWLLHVETGLIKDLNLKGDGWEQIKDTYKYKFNAL